MSRRSDPFAALADPTRRAILELLRVEPTLNAGAIAGRFPRISRAAVSQHLRVLRGAGLVRARQSGREWHYRLDPEPLAKLQREWFAQFEAVWEQSLAALKRRVEKRGA